MPGQPLLRPPPSPSVFEDGDLRIDYDAGIVTLAGNEVHLTPISTSSSTPTNVRKVLTTTTSSGVGGDSGSFSLRIRSSFAVGVGYRMVGMGQGHARRPWPKSRFRAGSHAMPRLLAR